MPRRRLHDEDEEEVTKVGQFDDLGPIDDEDEDGYESFLDDPEDEEEDEYDYDDEEEFLDEEE